MPAIDVRPAQSGEFEAVGALTAEAYVGAGVLPSHSPYVAQLHDARARSEATLLVAVDNAQRILGTVTFCRHGQPMAELARPGEAEFRMLAVSEAARGHGVGHILTQTCIDLARSHGDQGVVLSTQASMRAAHRIYERLGFTRLPERDWRPQPDVDLLAYYRDV